MNSPCKLLFPSLNVLRYGAFNKNKREMKLHHLNITCKKVAPVKSILQQNYGFQSYGVLPKMSWSKYKYVLKMNDIFMTITEDKSVKFDTIDDVAFCVESVSEYCENVSNKGGAILQKPIKVNCKGELLLSNDMDKTVDDIMEIAIVKSPIGNVKHTLLAMHNCNAEFLPGTIKNNNMDDHKTNCQLPCLDHIAFAFDTGHSMKYVNWYNECLKLNRIMASTRETQSGLIIQGKRGNGLRMLTLEEHPCAVTAAVSTNEVEVCNDNVKLVFAESLSNEGSDQIQSFLRCHGGAGVQHVAFRSNNILQDAQCWIDNGVTFVKPPSNYYAEVSSTLEKLKSKISLQEILEKGILIDAEKLQIGGTEEGYLYQVFTDPILEDQTFFFELIQRDKARGFGEGNISALWRALDAHIKAANGPGRES